MWQSLVLALSFVLVCGWFARGQDIPYTDATLDEIREQVESGEAILLDVREQDEWDAGHVKQAVLMPMSTLKEEKQREEQLAKLGKSKPIYCHCKVGGRAMMFAELVQGMDLDVRPMKYKYTAIAECGFETESE